MGGDGNGQGRRGEGHDGARITANDAGQEKSGLFAAFALIEVRVGAVGDDRVAVVHHLRGDVGVEVERYNDGETGPGEGAEAEEDFAVGVAMGFGDGGAVESDEKAIKRAHRLEGGEEGGGDAFEISSGNGAAGDGEGSETGDGFDAGGGAAIEEAAKFVAGAGPTVAEGVAGGHGSGGEILPAGGHAEKRVRFMEKTKDANARSGHVLMLQDLVAQKKL